MIFKNKIINYYFVLLFLILFSCDEKPTKVFIQESVKFSKILSAYKEIKIPLDSLTGYYTTRIQYLDSFSQYKEVLSLYNEINNIIYLFI